jgi:hypothetical protein
MIPVCETLIVFSFCLNLYVILLEVKNCRQITNIRKTLSCFVIETSLYIKIHKYCE